MSFASDAKLELSVLPIKGGCCAHAELAGLMFPFERTADRPFMLETEHPRVAKRFGVLARLAAETPRLHTVMRRRFGRHLSYQAILAAAEPAPRASFTKECCRRAFLRGAFLACGTIADPGKGYHLEWRFSVLEKAKELHKTARRYAPNAGVSKRGDDHIVYCKDSEQIADLLSAMGAVGPLLHLENVRIFKDLRNQANRIVNCESANVDKATQAAQNQIESIRYLEKRGALKSLSKELIEAAEIRMSYPEATLEELGGLLSHPIGKSGMNHRMRRLTAFARSMREKENTAW